MQKAKLIVVLAVLFLSCCMLHVEGPRSGRVVDADTGNPVAGAVVIHELDTLAMVTGWSRVYLAFRDTGVRVFDRDLTEVSGQPFAKLNGLIDSEITDLALGSSFSDQGLYVAFGRDKVLRSTLDGTLDYPVEFEATTLAADWYKSTPIPEQNIKPQRGGNILVEPGGIFENTRTVRPPLTEDSFKH